MRAASWSAGIPARIKGVTAARHVTDGPWLACSSPFGSTYGLGRRPEVRQGGQRHGPRASLPASKVSLQHLPRRTGRDWRVPVGSVRLTDLAGHRKYAIAPSVMVRGHPCPHQRCHCSASRDGRTIQVCSSRFGWPDGHRKFASAETVMVGGHPWERRRPRRQGFPNFMRVRPPTPEPLPTGATG